MTFSIYPVQICVNNDFFRPALQEMLKDVLNVEGK